MNTDSAPVKRQQSRDGVGDELGSVVEPHERRGAAALDGEAVEDPHDVVGVDRPVGLDGESFAGELADHIQQLQCSAVDGDVELEVRVELRRKPVTRDNPGRRLRLIPTLERFTVTAYEISRRGVLQRALLASRFSRALLALLLVCGVTIGQYSSADAVSQEQSTPCWHRLSLFYHQFNPNVARATIYTSGSNYCSWIESKVTASFFGGYLDGYSVAT